jgi:superfamily II DNA or RNA helicase
MNNQEKGLLYEKYVKDFIIQKIGKNAYLWNECPENILIENALVDSHNDMRLIRKDIKEGYLHTHKDIGIDIIQLDDNRCSIVQCKNGYSNGLCVDDISGIMMRSNFLKDVPTFIYYTNWLSRNIRYTAKTSPYVVNIDCSTNIDKLLEVPNDNKIYFVKLPYEDNNQEIVKTEIIPYSYQTEAVAKFKEHFQSNNRGILSLPCGCGKTYTSYMISSDYNHIIILSPLREFASQNLNRFIEYGYDETNTLLVDSDGNRDIYSIKDIIKNKNKLLISCTYNSMDLIAECLDLFKDALFIVDEFHNLSKANISDDENNIFKLLMSDHKILFMSATPRIYDIEYDDEAFDMEWLFGDVVYQMTFTYAITNRYITDYKIWLPSIHENNEELDKELSIYEIDNEIKNRCKFLYSCIANNGSRKCIVYCKDTEDMKSMMECMKTLNEFYIMDIEINSISCEDSEKKRKRTLESFANNNDKIQLLFNIRILNECIDIPSCDSIYISYAPKNKITTIQRISRATRTDKNNPYKIANIYIWCEEYEEILETLSSIKEYDIMFKDKIKINAVDFYHSKDEKEIELADNDKVLLSNCIVSVKEFRVMSWEEKLEMVEEYIEQNGSLPSKRDKNKEFKHLGLWITTQKRNHEYNLYCMKNTTIKKQWNIFINKYDHLFVSNDEKWKTYFERVKLYIENHDRLPSSVDKNKDIKKMGQWIVHQKKNYKEKKGIIQDNNIKHLWEEFVNKYQSYFMTNEEIWKYNFDKVKQYIDENNKLPPYHKTSNKFISLAKWISEQQQNFKHNERIMQDKSIRKQWEEFLIKYQSHFLTNEEIWKQKLTKVEEYIIINNTLPSHNDINTDIVSLARWICTQKRNYENNKEIMKDICIRQHWEDFVNKYQSYFMTNEEIWKHNFDKVEEYIIINNILPSHNDINTDIVSLARWICTQKRNYENNQYSMKNTIIKQQWEDFINKYKSHFLTNEELWNNKLHNVMKYIDENNKLPSEENQDKDIKQLGRWIVHQKKNYKDNKEIMKVYSIRQKWEDFVNKYHLYFMTNKEIWNNKLNCVIRYIQDNNKLPSKSNKNRDIYLLESWVSTQKQNYKNKTKSMKDPELRQQWEEFIAKYPHLF